MESTLDEFERLKADYRGSNNAKRREAVKNLVKLDTADAWELVIDALADPISQVADEAQIGIANLPGDKHGELFGKRGLGSKREIAALRVAEALGRMHVEFTDKQFGKGLAHKSSDVRRSTLWSLERLARRGIIQGASQEVLKQVTKIARKDKEEVVQAHALVTLAALNEAAAVEFVLDFWAAKSAVKRTAAMEIIDLVPARGRMALLRLAIDDPAFSVRLSAYDSARKLGHQAAMKFLVDALEKEPRPRCAWHIVNHLRSSTGMKYGLDPRPWRDWFANQPIEWKAGEGKPEGEVGEDGTTSLAGMRVISSHVTFLIDFSGSMWKETDGKTLKQLVDVEMRQALEGLKPEVMFNVQPYTDDSTLWGKKLKPASERNVKKAIAFFEGCTMRGKGDFWSAMQIAMKDQDVDTLMLLGDGAPSGGQRWNMTLMKRLFKHENRFRRIALDSLLVGANGFITGQWETISLESGGRCMSVDL
ncbi:MAG: hypothetical protein P8N31_01510 [Planctomycetota bacterium]|nr:hypothetical protein [Planctomycetota bacterium]